MNRTIIIDTVRSYHIQKDYEGCKIHIFVKQGTVYCIHCKNLEQAKEFMDKIDYDIITS